MAPRSVPVLRFAWRWAKAGDKVLVHDRDNLKRPLMPGTVERVNRVDGQTSVGIRLSDTGDSRFLWPTPLFVHPDPLDPDESCWICAENAAAGAVDQPASLPVDA